MPLLSLVASNPEAVHQLTIEQVVATAGDGRLRDGTDSQRELRALEIENLPGGGTRIGHPRHGHDDYADAIALAVSEARCRAGSPGSRRM